MRELIIFAIAFLWMFPSAIAFLLLLLHRTHFVIEYASIFGLSRLFKKHEFLEWEKENFDRGYFVFLDERHSTFITRLFRCPWCLATWLAGAFNIFVMHGLVPYVGTGWAVLFGWVWTFSVGFFAVILYFLGIIVYKLAFSPEKS